jgi:hypothetical protein
MITWGFFWKKAATAFTGAFSFTSDRTMKPSEPMPISTAPDAMRVGTLTPGPP